ncbi:MAG TPA: hypothetical protein VEB86_08530, partial [Chryseosolibacter sp.]|nr:hypothetical protein [Chryseosolibacter sp.]
LDLLPDDNRLTWPDEAHIDQRTKKNKPCLRGKKSHSSPSPTAIVIAPIPKFTKKTLPLCLHLPHVDHILTRRREVHAHIAKKK